MRLQSITTTIITITSEMAMGMGMEMEVKVAKLNSPNGVSGNLVLVTGMQNKASKFFSNK